MLVTKKSTPKKALSILLSIAIVLSLFTAFSINTGFAAVNAVAQNGQLKIVGSQLCNQSGQAIQLKGMSSHGIQWYGNYVNYNSMKWLRDDWGITVFRVAMYTAENGYISNPSLKNKVKEAVEAAIDLGLYIIIDWHILQDNDPNMYKQQAKEFFREMATLYGNYPNVIYEIANEPNGGVTWNGHIKPYAEEVIPVIRAIDPDNIIIVGTGTWSQDIHDAANNPLKFSNIMYALHFYAGTHGQYLRDRIDYAMSKGAAIFVSEWGTSDASGGGGVYLSQSQTWIDFMASRKISWANWSLSDKAESSAALNPGASTSGGWTDANLSTSGKFIKSKIGGGGTTPTTSAPVAPTPTKSPVPTPSPISVSKVIPGTFEAEAYDGMYGIQTESCVEGGLNVGWIDVGDWMDYRVNVQSSGTYTVEYRVASLYGTGRFSLRNGSTVLASTTVPNTGGWQNWTTVKATVNLSAGQQTLRLYADGSPFNVNWIKFSTGGSSSPAPSPVIVPTPTKSPVTAPTPTPTTVAPSQPPSTGSGALKVQFFNGGTSSSSNSIHPKFKITNTGSTSISLADVKLRYYYTIDGEKAQTYWCDWSPVGTSNVNGKFVKMSQSAAGADYYLEIGFTSGAGSLAPGASIEIQGRFAKSDWTNYNQTNDYSFNSAASSFVDWNKVTGHIGSQQVWGVAP
ncbi:MAG: cellulase family glycosylhydrolase [Bacillota bacterium]